MEIEHSDAEEPVPINEEEEDDTKQHKTLNHHSLYYSFLQRYFTSYQTTAQYLHRHSNGLFVIRVRTEALTSPVVQIRNVLQIHDVRGKKKRGGTKVHRYTVIVELICKDQTVVPITALVDGVILERNQRLSPEILDTPAGFVAAINPGKKFRAEPQIFTEILLPHQMKQEKE